MSKGSLQSGGETSSALESALTELYEKSRGSELGLEKAEFAAILREIACKYVAPSASEGEVVMFCRSLRVEELALARACALGRERAWEIFLLRYREKLYDIAIYITKESSAARELADSLYADLYGTTAREGQRISKLASYTGRGSLEGWLRTVLAQEHVNRYRRGRRLVSLEEESEEGVQYAAAEPAPTVAVDSRVEAATDEVLTALSSEDRFLLAAYYLDGRKLAEIARMLGVHESTISRKLEKLAKSLRKQILVALGRRGMSRRQAEEALQVDVRDVRVNLRQRLAQETPSGAFSGKKVEVHIGEGCTERTGPPSRVEGATPPLPEGLSGGEGLHR
jgi:RNA polymerase sigma-70 factor (ECF subfamily)